MAKTAIRVIDHHGSTGRYYVVPFDCSAGGCCGVTLHWMPAGQAIELGIREGQSTEIGAVTYWDATGQYVGSFSDVEIPLLVVERALSEARMGYAGEKYTYWQQGVELHWARAEKSLSIDFSRLKHPAKILGTVTCQGESGEYFVRFRSEEIPTWLMGELVKDAKAHFPLSPGETGSQSLSAI